MPSPKNWKVTLWSGNISNSGKDETRYPVPSVEEHPIKFRSYDDDGIFYAEGTARGVSSVEDVHDVLQGSYGVTETRFYDRSTGLIIDAIG